MDLSQRKSAYGLQSSGRHGKTDFLNERVDSLREVNEKASNLRQFYEMRILSFEDTLKQLFKTVQQDELIDTMKQDSASEEFVTLRVKEIITSYLESQRETLIEKVSNQYSSLKVEYIKLQQDYSKLENSVRDASEDAERRIQELQEEMRKDRKDKELYTSENESLKARLKELSQKHDENLRKKDSQLFQVSENELIYYKQQLAELQLELQKKEKTSYEWEIEREKSKRDLEREKSKLREVENECSKLRNELEETKSSLSQSRRNFEESDQINRESKLKIKALSDEVKALKTELNSIVAVKSALEDKLNNRDVQLRKELISEQNVAKENMSKIESKYKAKIKEYKQKVIKFSEEVNIYQRELYEFKKKSDADRIISEKNTEILQLKMQEQKENYEHKLFLLEDDHQRKIQEVHLHYDEQITVLQDQFQGLLNNRIHQLQEDANQQIQSVRAQELQLQALLEEKMHQIEQEYLPVSLHETKIQEKQHVIDTLKSELNTRQKEARDELYNKLKTLEDRMRKEAEISDVNARDVINDLESKVSASSSENVRLNGELKRETEKNKTYANVIREYEAERKKLVETVEELTIKNNHLEKSYEEEINNLKQLENDNQTLKKGILGIRSAFEALKQEKENLGENFKALSKENEALRAEIQNENKRSRALDRELEELHNESQNAENRSNQAIKELKEQIQELNQDNKQLNDRIINTMQAANEKFEKESSAHYETKNSLNLTENALTQRDNEIRSLLTQQEKQRLSLERAEYTINELHDDLRARESEIEGLLKDKQDLLKQNEQQKLRAQNFKNQVKSSTQARLKALRRDLEEAKNYSRTISGDLAKEMIFKVENLAAGAREVISKQHSKFIDEINYLKSKLISDYNLRLQEQGEGYERSHKQVVDALERKLHTQGRDHETLKIDHELLTKRLTEAEKEFERASNEIYRLEEELSQANADNALITREKESIELKYEQAKHRHNSEFQQLNRQFEHLKEENTQSRKELQAKQDAEIKELQDALENTSKKHERAIIKYEEQVESLEAVHEQELIAIQKAFTEKIKSLNDTNQSLEVVIQELIEKLKALQDNVTELEQDRTAKEQQRQELQADYEARIEALSYNLQEQRLNADLETENLQRLKREKTREFEALQQQIKRLQDDVTLKSEKINTLQQEKARLEDKAKDLQRQFDVKAFESDKHKRELLERQRSQAKEIEQLHGLLSKSYMSAGGSRDLKINIDTEDKSKELPEMELSKSVKGLKSLDKYLEASRSPKEGLVTRTSATYGKIAETPERQDNFGQFQAKKPLSISQLKP